MTKVAENCGIQPQVDSIKHTRAPSLRAVKYVQNLTKGMSKHEAALQAGYSLTVANTPRSGIEKSPTVQ